MSDLTCPVVPFTRIHIGSCCGSIHRIEGDDVYVRGTYTYPDSPVDKPQQEHWEASFKKNELVSLPKVWFNHKDVVIWDAADLNYEFSSDWR